ncbi:MAG TPA: gamma-glutamyltransferase [Gemmataceae bacterium]|nr:gamma-glutamyltransferase [Gemmataceae bacterium]
MAFGRPTRRQFLGQASVLATGCLGTPLRSADRLGGLLNGQPQAAEAGLAVLAAGGNAVDAAVCAALVAGVVAVPSCGIGGYGGHLVIANPGGKVTAIDFNSAAPAAAKPDMFTADEKGVVKGQVNNFGWLAAGVPGTLAGLQLAIDKFGTKKFAELVRPAIRYAREGFPVTQGFANAIKTAKDRFAKDPGSAKLFLPKGVPPAEGSTFRNPDLADLLQALADKGRVDDFYTGRIAEKVAAAFRQHGGLVTAEDMAAYKAVEITPLALASQKYTIHTPPPTAGGLTVLQAVAILKELKWQDHDPKEPATVHARVEALRIAWGDRLRLLGDPKYADVPVEKLLSDKYVRDAAERVAAAVRDKRPVDTKAERRTAGGTIHLNAIDASGMAVAITLTHGNSFGAQVTVDGLGLVLGHGMSRFDPRPGRPNSVGPGKRPLHNMCPTVVTREGTPVIALGATGGRRIVNTVFDVLAYRLGEGKPLADSIKAPRVHTEGDLDLTLEKDWPAGVVERFREIGFAVKAGGAATASAIERDPKTGTLEAARR